MRRLDATDIKVLNILQTDGRITNKALSERLGLSTTPIFERMRRLENDGVIERFVAILNQKKIDKKFTGFAYVAMKEHTRPHMEAFIEETKQHDDVHEIYHISGDYDYMFKIVSKDVEEFRSFVYTKFYSNPNVRRVKTELVLLRDKYTTAYKLD